MLTTWVAVLLAGLAAGIIGGILLSVFVAMVFMGRVEQAVASVMGKWHGLQSLRYERKSDGTLVRRVA